MKLKFFLSSLETEASKNKQIKNFCENINKISTSCESTFKFYSVCNEYGWDATLNKLSTIAPYATKAIRVALLLGESNLLSILPELLGHADVILCNDINSDLNRYTQFLVQGLVQSSSRKEFEEHYKKQENGQYCNPLAGKYNLDEEWNLLISNSIGDKHFLSSDERFALCKEQLSKLNIVWHNANLFNESDCSELSELLKKHQAVISVINVTNLHPYTRKPLKYQQLLQSLLNSNPSPIILYSVGDGSYSSSFFLKSKISIGTEEYFSLLGPDDRIIDYRTADDRWAGWKKNTTLVDNLIKIANIILKKHAVEYGTNIPPLIFDKSFLAIRFDFNKLALSADFIPKDTRSKRFRLMKGLLGWNKKRRLDEEEFFQGVGISLKNRYNSDDYYILSMKDKKIYYCYWKDGGDWILTECNIIDFSSFNDLINKIKNNDLTKELRNNIRLIIELKNKHLIDKIENKEELLSAEKNKEKIAREHSLLINYSPELKELFINSIGHSRFELTLLDEGLKGINFYSLALFVKQNLPILNTYHEKMEEKSGESTKLFNSLVQGGIEKFLFSLDDLKLDTNLLLSFVKSNEESKEEREEESEGEEESENEEYEEYEEYIEDQAAQFIRLR